MPGVRRALHRLGVVRVVSHVQLSGLREDHAWPASTPATTASCPTDGPHATLGARENTKGPGARVSVRLGRVATRRVDGVRPLHLRIDPEHVFLDVSERRGNIAAFTRRLTMSVRLSELNMSGARDRGMALLLRFLFSFCSSWVSREFLHVLC